MGRTTISSISGLAFLAIFPLFYFYHFGLAQGLIPPFLAGWHGPMTLIFVGPLVLATLVYLSRNNLSSWRDWIAATAFGFLVYAGAWLLANVVLLPNNPAHSELATAILAMAVYFLIGAMLDLNWRFLRRAVMVCWAIMALQALTNVGGANLTLDLNSESGDLLYQGLARSMMVTSMLAVAMQHKTLTRLFVGAVSITALFVIGARSELYGFMVAYVAMEAVANRRSGVGMFLFAAVLVFAVALVASSLDMLGGSRQLQVLDLEVASSWRARQYLEGMALDQISGNPVMGVYGGHWELSEGSYAHNALSAWVSLGLIGFLLYVTLAVGAVWRAFMAMVAQPEGELNRMAFLVGVASLLLIVVAKPFFWAVPALAWGLTSKAVPVRSKASVMLA